MENSEQINVSSAQTQFDSNKIESSSMKMDKQERGHDPYDPLPNTNEQQPMSISLLLNSIQKFDGHGDPQQWLKYILDRFDSLRISSRDRYTVIPDILTGEALIWYVQQQDRMPTFLTFMKKFLHYYTPQEEKIELSQISIPSSVLAQSTEATVVTTTSDNVMDCLRNQMLITNLEKLQKYSGNQKQNVSRWLQEIQQTMNMFKMTDTEKLCYVSLCLTDNARDWFYDNPHLCSTWIMFTQNLLTTFQSAGNAEISFNKLRHYEQSLNQNVRQYYFDIMTLCKEANPSMDDATKLQYLKDGLKPSLRFDVLLRNPQTTREFLEYAQKIEELKSLVDTTDTTVCSDERQTTIQSNPSNQTQRPHLNTTKSKFHYNKVNSNSRFNNTLPIQDQRINPTPKPPYQCYKCGGTDHYIRNCPHFQ